MAKDDYAAYYPEADKSTDDSDSLERSKAIASMPVIQDVLDWFDEQVNELKNPLLITGITERTPAEEVKSQILNTQKLIRDYKDRRDQFVSRFKDYIEELPIEQA